MRKTELDAKQQRERASKVKDYQKSRGGDRGGSKESQHNDLVSSN